jgi:hypothetical protein
MRDFLRVEDLEGSFAKERVVDRGVGWEELTMYLGERIVIREGIIYAIDGLGSLLLVLLFPVILFPMVSLRFPMPL